jgi:hypothetical protein
MKRRRVLITLTVAGAIVATAPGTAAARPPADAGCFGQFVAGFAQNPPPGFANLGEELRELARQPGPFGTTVLPGFKALACGGD